MSPASTAASTVDDGRIADALRIVEDAGIDGALVSVDGPEREIAAIRVPAGDWDRQVGDEGVRLAEAVRALGFRYVALDLLPADG